MQTFRIRCAALLLAATPAVAARGGELEIKTFERAWSLIDRNFYDDDKNGVDWDAVREKYLPVAESTENPEEVRLVIQRMLAELGVSHCSVIDGDIYRSMMAELANKREPTFGLLLEESSKGRFFARAIFEGGPADDVGIRLGDRVVAIDSIPIADSERLVDAGYDPGLAGPKLWFLRVGDVADVELTIEPEPDRASRRTVALTARAMNGVDAMKNSARVVERDGLRLGVIHMWYCSRGVASALRRAVTNELKDCDALVLDIRGRGGFADVVNDVVKVFRGSSPGVMRRLRGDREAEPPLWTRPVVVLIDGRSRSAKEILAWRVRHHAIGVLVGERTEGAVLGAMFHPLPDGSYLELPGVAVPVEGVSLEGVGVPPDLAVEFTLPYAGGFDPILESGLAIAAMRALESRRGPF